MTPPSQSNDATTGEARTVEMHGREIVLIVSKGLDDYGQFRVTLMLDGKERYGAYFTDKSDQ